MSWIIQQYISIISQKYFLPCVLNTCHDLTIFKVVEMVLKIEYLKNETWLSNVSSYYFLAKAIFN